MSLRAQLLGLVLAATLLPAVLLGWRFSWENNAAIESAVKTLVTRNDPLLAPLSKGQAVGRLQVTLNGQPWQTLPLQSLDDVPAAGWLGRAWDALRLSIQ